MISSRYRLSARDGPASLFISAPVGDGRCCILCVHLRCLTLVIQKGTEVTGQGMWLTSERIAIWADSLLVFSMRGSVHFSIFPAGEPILEWAGPGYRSSLCESSSPFRASRTCHRRAHGEAAANVVAHPRPHFLPGLTFRSLIIHNRD